LLRLYNIDFDGKYSNAKSIWQHRAIIIPRLLPIYVKNCSVYIQCKGDIVDVDIKQHKSQFENSNFTITQSAKFF